MNNTNSQNAEKALKITTLLTLIVAGYEFLSSCQNYQSEMNIFDIASYGNSNLEMYCLVLIMANLILIPNAILLYKQSGISLKNEILDKSSLSRDVILGIVLAVVSSIIGLFTFFVMSRGRTDLAFSGWDKLNISEIILMVISLTFVSGICKEIFFRGFAKNFCGSVLGENTALLLFNIMFSLLDWFNMGQSFVFGLIWIWGYKKSKHLIVPMIAHGGVNFICVIFYIITL